MMKKFLLTFAMLSIFACTGSEPPKTERVNLRIVYPPGLSTIMQAVGSQIESEPAPTTPAIKIEHIAEYSINAANKLSSGEIKAEAWISPMSSLVDYANGKIINLGAKHINCRKLFETPVVIATQDVFVENFKEKAGIFSWNDFMDLTSAASQGGQNYAVSYAMGVAETTTSGLPSLLQLLYFAKPEKATQVSPDNFKDGAFNEKFQKYINRVAHYSPKEDNLFYKASTIQDHIFFAFTTEQELINYNQTKGPGEKPLYALYPQEGSIRLDYVLCSADADWVVPVQKAALKALGDWFLRPAKQQEFINYGFRSALPELKEDAYSSFPQYGATTVIPAQPAQPIADGVIKQVTSNGAKYKKPFAAMYVLDTSGSTENANVLSAGKRMMRALLAGSDPKDLSALMTFSEDPKIIRPFDNNHGDKIKALDVQQGTGGSSLYDAIAESIRAITKEELNGYRKVIYVFTDGNDNNSKTSLGTLLDLIRETRRHHDISFEIVALKTPNVDLADVERIAKSFSGNMYPVTLGDIDKVVVELSGAY